MPDIIKQVHPEELYREFLAERDEILRHKWIESERLGRDIGFEQALTEWTLEHRAVWRVERAEQARPD
ncbi:MAG: DUF4032 domain-containing protein [Verrucomicrobiaceae bacterium]|nr:DUF4032 domain-containing protein [Verrucomicrobiaceae bacterium]